MCMSILSCMSMCYMGGAWLGALVGQSRVSDPLKLESEIVVSNHVSAGPEPGFSARASSVFNLCDIPPVTLNLS